jgi:hypothetical protein
VDGTCRGEEKKVYTVVVGKPEGKRPFGRPRLSWKEEIRMDLGDNGWEVWSGSSWLKIRAGCGLL